VPDTDPAPNLETTSEGVEERKGGGVVSLAFLLGFGLGSFVGVILAVVAVLAIRGPADEPKIADNQEQLLAPLTPTPTPQVQVTPDGRPRTKDGGNVYLGPGLAFAIVGTVSRGEPIEIVGRDAESQWVAIRFPPNSSARGWISADTVDGLTSLERFTVVAPTPLPTSLTTTTPSSGFPTTRPGGTQQTFATLTPTPSGSSTPTTPVITRTPVPSGPPDLVVTAATLLPDGRVSVVIGNRGPGDASGQPIFVNVRDLTLRGEQIIGSSTLRAGSTFVVQTQSFKVERETSIQVTVDPAGSIQDGDRGNNSLTVTLSPPPTATPITPN
jgi:uncharacterized protein YraI